jgi:hypothetical protein
MTQQSDNERFVRAYQQSKGLKMDGWAGKETLASLPQNEVTSVNSAVIPDDYWPMLSKIESGDRPYIKASTSSASGLYQFIKATWLGESGDWGPNASLAFGGLKPSPDEQLRRAKTFTQKNANALARAGIPVNRASLYAAHFLGAGTAIEALEGGVNDRIDKHVGHAAIAANPSILGGGKTVADFLTWLHKKTGAWAK